MPGMVAFRRRWSVGSDDLVLPALFLIILHTAWILVLALIRGLLTFDNSQECTVDLRNHIIGYIIILAVCVVVESAVAWVSMRGSILSPEPRKSMEYLLYVRLVLGFVELAWLILGAVWSGRHYQTCRPETAKKALLGIMICNWIMMLSCLISVWCTYDTAGAKWVKMKKYQDSMKERRRNHRRQSGSRRNWRQRKAFRAYEESWDRRLQLLCCCVERKGRNKNSMSEIAQLFTEFFRDLDVVPSDIVAGLVLMRHHQKQRTKTIIAQDSNDVYQYLSGVPVTPTTRFLQLTQPEVMGEFIKVIHYMRFALAAYGWPIYVMMNPGTWLCRLLPTLSCCCHARHPNATVADDNCCGCNLASLKRISGLQDLDIIYATYHVDIGETPFFVALDHEFGKVVVCVRGTLSLQDVLTDLKAEPETLPLNIPKDEWQGHKGMVQAAVYIKKKLIDDKILDMAWERDELPNKITCHTKLRGRDVAKYELVCVGHSLGAGTAAILAILLKSEYPTLHCYAFSPPGGLLTLPCVEETKSYITSVVVGKDVVPRIGLPQLEMLRTDIINLIKSSRKSKWNIIAKGFCGCDNERFFDVGNLDLERDVTAHPSNSAIGLSAHVPLYPPGKMIHVVRSHIANKSSCKGSEAIYQAIWASNGDFDEVLVSPTMINDHMPDNVLQSLEKVLQRVGPQKPMRTMTEPEHQVFLSQLSESSSATPSPSQAQGFLETSFTSDVVMRNPSTGGPQREKLAGSWDHAAEQILHLQQNSGNGTTLPNPGVDNSIGSIAKPQTLPLSMELVHAPLASPETLSMASGVISGSVASGLIGGLSQSESVWDNLRKSLSNPPPQDSVADSNPPARIEGAHVELSPGKKHKENVRGRVERPHSCQPHTAADKAAVSAEADRTVSPQAHSTLHTSAVQDAAGDRQSECKQTDSSVLPIHYHQSSQKLHTAFASPVGMKETVVKTDLDQNILNHLPSDGVATNLSSVSASTLNTVVGDKVYLADPQNCVRHSPVETSQGEYEHPNLHYSQASTGYPHGAYHPPIRYNSTVAPEHIAVFPNISRIRQHRYEHRLCPTSKTTTPSVDLPVRSTPTSNSMSPMPNPAPHPFIHCQSESSIFSKHFPPKLGMKRSAEHTNICHLEDETDVYPADKDLFTIKRSTEQKDVAHLDDDFDVFDETEDTLGHLTTSRSRLIAVHSTPRSSTVGSVGQRPEVGSRHASSSHSSRSDDVFEADVINEATSETDL